MENLGLAEAVKSQIEEFEARNAVKQKCFIEEIPDETMVTENYMTREQMASRHQVRILEYS